MTALLVCLDIDGTTVTYANELRPRVRDAVRAVVDAGHHVVLSTGRSIVGTLPVLDQLGIRRGHAVCSNGALTARLTASPPNGWEPIEVVTFDPQPALDLLHGAWPDAVVAVEVVGLGHKVSGVFPPHELEGDQVLVPWHELGTERVTRLTFRSPTASVDEFTAMVESLGLHGVSYGVGFTAWLDITPEGVSKASALEMVRRNLGVEPAHTVSVGDQRNDLEMLAWAARGVAMGNAPDEVKAVADEVTASVDDDGLALVLESLLATRVGAGAG